MKKTSSENIRVLKRDTCKSLSGKSKISYQVGFSSDNNIYFRITENTGGGFFSSHEWIPLNAILQTFKKVPKNTPLTSVYLFPLFEGKSVNTPSFLMAVLLNENLIETLPKKIRCHRLIDSKSFEEKMKQLTTSETVSPGVLKKRALAKKVSKKTATKKRPSTSKKKTVTKK